MFTKCWRKSSTVNPSRDETETPNNAAGTKDKEIETLKRAAGTKDTEIQDLKWAAEIKDADIETLKRAAEIKDAEIETLKWAAEIKDTEIGGLKTTSKTKEATITLLTEKLETSTSIVAELENSVETKDAEVARLSMTMKAKDTEIELLNTIVEAKDLEMARLNINIETKNTAITRLETTVESKDANVQRLNRVVDSKISEITSLVLQAHAKDSAIERLDAEIALRKMRNTADQDNITELMKKTKVQDEIIERLKKTVDAKELETRALVLSVKTKTEVFNELTLKSKFNKAELERLSDANAKIARLTPMSKELASIHGELASVREAIAKAITDATLKIPKLEVEIAAKHTVIEVMQNDKIDAENLAKKANAALLTIRAEHTEQCPICKEHKLTHGDNYNFTTMECGCVVCSICIHQQFPNTNYFRCPVCNKSSCRQLSFKFK